MDASVAAGAVGFAIAVCVGVTLVFAFRVFHARPMRVKARAAAGVRPGDAPGNMFELGLAHLERLVERVERRALSRLLVGDLVHELRQVLDEMRALSDNDRLLDRVDTSQATDQFASSWFSLGMGATQYQVAEARQGGNARGSVRASSTIADGAPGDDAVSALGRSVAASLSAALRLPNEAVELMGWIRGGFHEWDFDMARLRSWCASAGVPPLLAITLAMHADDAPGALTRTLGCAQGALVSFVQRVISEYRRLPYHSELHACDVLHAASVLHRRLCGSAATPLETGAMALAAMVHDLSHPGVNNAFLVETASPLAIRYNDASVLENHHISLAFSIMLGLERARPPATSGGAPADAGGNPLGGLERADYKAVRSEMVQLVMATSFEHHFQHIGNLKAKAKPRDARHAGGAPASADELKAAAEERLMLLKMIIKAADIGHPARAWAWHVDSAKRACAEFFYQGECEARTGLPVSPLNNAAECNLAKAQTGFLEFMVKPAFEVLRLYVEASPAATEPAALDWLRGPLDHLETNIANWKAMSDDESAALKADILAIEIAEPFDPGWFADSGGAAGGAVDGAVARTPPPIDESQSRRQSRLSLNRGGSASSRIGRILSTTLGLNAGSRQRSCLGSPGAHGSQSNLEREPSFLRSSSQADSPTSRADLAPSPFSRAVRRSSRAEAALTVAAPLASAAARSGGEDDELTSVVPGQGGPPSGP